MTQDTHEAIADEVRSGDDAPILAVILREDYVAGFGDSAPCN
jgi:hypothetical protein